MKSYNFLEKAQSICRVEKPISIIITYDMIIYEYTKVIKILYKNRIEYLYEGLRMTVNPQLARTPRRTHN